MGARHQSGNSGNIATTLKTPIRPNDTRPNDTNLENGQQQRSSYQANITTHGINGNVGNTLNVTQT